MGIRPRMPAVRDGPVLFRDLPIIFAPTETERSGCGETISGFLAEVGFHNLVRSTPQERPPSD